MPTLKLAKYSAAHKACKILYENGELNENLLPINAYRCLTSICHTFFQHWDEPENGKQHHNMVTYGHRNNFINVPLCHRHR